MSKKIGMAVILLALVVFLGIQYFRTRKSISPFKKVVVTDQKAINDALKIANTLNNDYHFDEKDFIKKTEYELEFEIPSKWKKIDNSRGALYSNDLKLSMLAISPVRKDCTPSLESFKALYSSMGEIVKTEENINSKKIPYYLVKIKINGQGDTLLTDNILIKGKINDYQITVMQIDIKINSDQLNEKIINSIYFKENPQVEKYLSCQ